MILSAIVWLLQDFSQVLAMGFMLVPEFFMLVVIYKVVSGPITQQRIAQWLWFAFLGGVLWDLRWFGLPGMSGLINIFALLVVYWIWGRTPVGGRNAFLLATLGGSVHFLSGIAHYLAWAVPSQEALRMFAVQQLLMIPILVLICTVYAFKVPQAHV